MPKLEKMDQNQTSHFGYSAMRINDLGASEYTLVVIVQDESPSVAPWKDGMEAALGLVIKTCGKSPRKDNLLVRVTTFCDVTTEVHGFKPLSEIKPEDYLGVLCPRGLTALFDASQEGVETLADYGKKLTDSDFAVNGIVFVITDGLDNRSRVSTPEKLRQTIRQATQSEALESLRVVLVGVGDAGTQQYLDDFAQRAGIDQRVALADADENTLAKLADFVSRSISATSQALGTGGPSQALTF